MTFTDLFVRRPVLALVVSTLILLFGALALSKLPIRQYPLLENSTITISTDYPGASSELMQGFVTQPIAQAVSSVEGVDYLSSSSVQGRSVVTVRMALNRDSTQALTEVMAKVNQVRYKLPEQAYDPVIERSAGEATAVAYVGFSSKTLSTPALSEYLTRVVEPMFTTIDGVAKVEVFGGQKMAMRLWLDSDRLAGRGLTAADVADAVRRNNYQAAPGKVKGQYVVANVRVNTDLTSVEEFRNLVVRNDGNGLVRLKDVGTVELGAAATETSALMDGEPAVFLGVFPTPTGNPLVIVDGIRHLMPAIDKMQPPGVKMALAFETARFIQASIDEVVHTLLEALAIVVAVIYLCLGSLRTVLIPVVTIPLSILGAAGLMLAFGFSVNLLTLLAMVLAIGLVVDDAIVVVENVERVMSEEGLPPREATRKSMGQIQSALVGIALVLSAVFVPMAFFGGTTGAIYRQFSITIVSAMVLSVLVAMILTPALCATLLKPIAKGHHHGKRGFFGWFNRMFNRNADRYERGVGRILHASGRYMVIYLLLLGGMALLFIKLPTSFLPQEDRGIFTVQVQLPAGSTLQQTSKVVEKVERYFLTEEKQDVLSVFAIIGSGPGGNGQNVARLFVRLKDWDLRTSGANSSFDIIDRATLAFNKINEARVIASSPPAITGLGNSSGFDMELEDHAGLGHAKLMAARDQLLQLAAQNPLLSRVRHNGLDDSPQLQIDIDQRKAQALGVSIDDINNTLSTAWGSTYVNDFVDRGRVKKVYVQAAAPFRMLPDDINKWYVRNSAGGMVPFSAFASSHWEYGSPRLERYNGSSALEIVGEAANGVSTGTAMAEMEKLVSQLPTGFGLEWTAMSYQERLSGSQAPALYAISLLVVFLCLAALYESWSIPFSVMLVVPLGVIGAVAATWLRGLENDVYFQVGLLTIIGLSAKNAILIVEFANELNHKGQDLMSATLDASRMRLRPILMTSLAFIFGVLPMATSSGAGSGSQHAVGTGVMGGMISATLLAIFFVPLFFVLVRRRFPGKAHPAGNTPATGD
ncbi:efflux RND transporter permease subunit [Serratia marcescens]|uniref:efflux RND transporter permease subunit n=1 Tax=Serratia marcescens TaxID=615 RepID=UPI000F7E3D33|nr:efflux RND transporter permease subunit [Serratia marcescens]RTF47971.1 efflux RND transporter permease subunit [Serratia marcescens]RTG24306.1 efflux RND transporter permease subunit [Serratia marcescens]RTG40138.1 efflux RND transporter permease subunit [Serratia marcescens]RTG69509.1 efflux RND transporter permease subunit [Serratia marcescens]RTG77637.1 efflux RND transporter permease subunit [Serratia marcescens]